MQKAFSNCTYNLEEGFSEATVCRIGFQIVVWGPPGALEGAVQEKTRSSLNTHFLPSKIDSEEGGMMILLMWGFTLSTVTLPAYIAHSNKNSA